MTKESKIHLVYKPRGTVPLITACGRAFEAVRCTADETLATCAACLGTFKNYKRSRGEKWGIKDIHYYRRSP